MKPSGNRSSAFNKQSWLIITTLFVALSGGYLVASANYYDSNIVSCDSDHYRKNFCRVDTRGGVRLFKQKSDAPCIKGKTWGYNRFGIWVDRGCRARFEIGGCGLGSGCSSDDKIKSCESNDFRKNFCRVDTRGGVCLFKQKSDAPCILGKTWGYNRFGIWVDCGCRGKFKVRKCKWDP